MFWTFYHALLSMPSWRCYCLDILYPVNHNLLWWYTWPQILPTWSGLLCNWWPWLAMGPPSHHLFHLCSQGHVLQDIWPSPLRYFICNSLSFHYSGSTVVVAWNFFRTWCFRCLPVRIGLPLSPYSSVWRTLFPIILFYLCWFKCIIVLLSYCVIIVFASYSEGGNSFQT